MVKRSAHHRVDHQIFGSDASRHSSHVMFSSRGGGFPNDDDREGVDGEGQ